MRQMLASCLAIVIAISYVGTQNTEAQASVIFSGDIDISVDSVTNNQSNPVNINFGGFAQDSAVFYAVAGGGLLPSMDIYLSGNSALSIGRTGDAVIDKSLRVFAAGESSDIAVNWGSTAGILHGEFATLSDSHQRGPFHVGEIGYLAIRFQSTANTEHYGWIRYQAIETSLSAASGKITGWAYESTPAQAITVAAVPEPSSMILLIIGSAGIGFVRRRPLSASRPVQQLHPPQHLIS